MSDADAAEFQVQRARLSAVQARSTSFRGFSEEELDNLLPFLSLIEFEDGDPIMRCGEDATWTGVLLGGELEAVLPNGKVIGTVVPGTVVGEMALFRGGKRGCDMRATIAGSIAVLKFSDVDNVARESPLLAHKLLLAFAREGYLHMVFPQASPFVRVSKIEGGFGMSQQAIFDPFKQKLSSRGWPQAELAPLFAALEVDTVDQGMTVLVKGRTIEFVVFVLRGCVTHGAKRHPVGDIIGASYAVSGVPVLDEAVTESESILGMLSLKRLEQLGDGHPRLAAKLLRLLGVLALGGDLDMAADMAAGDKGSGGAAGGGGGAKGLRRRLNNSLQAGDGAADGAAADGSGGGKNLKTMEIVFQRQLADQEAKRVMLQDTMLKMQHEKKRENLVLSKMQREKNELAQQIVQLTEEVKRAQKANEKVQAQLAKRADEVKHHEMRVKILEAALEAANVPLPHTFPIEKKGSSKMMAMLQKAMTAKAKEAGTQPAAAAGAKPVLEKAMAAKAKDSARADDSFRSEGGGGKGAAAKAPPRPPALDKVSSNAAGGGAVGSPGGGGAKSPSHAADAGSVRLSPHGSPSLAPTGASPGGGAGGGAGGVDTVPHSPLPPPMMGEADGGAAADADADEEGVRRVFAAYDSDGSGSIDVSELRAALVELGLDAESLGLSPEEWEAQLDEIMRRYDADGSGTLELAEFRQLIGELRGDEPPPAEPAGDADGEEEADGAEEDELVVLINKLYEAEESVSRSRTVDEVALQGDIGALEHDLDDISRAYVEAHGAAISALARGRWARALAFVCREQHAMSRMGASVKWAVAVAAARHAELRNESHLAESAQELERAKHRVRLASESNEVLAARSEALAEEHESLVEKHSGLVKDATAHKERVQWLEHRLQTSAEHIDGHVERAAQVATGRAARLETELWKLKWQLEQAEEQKAQQALALRQATASQHSIGASHADLSRQHADDLARLHLAEREVERLRDELRVEREIARDRMAALIDERRRARLCLAEVHDLRGGASEIGTSELMAAEAARGGAHERPAGGDAGAPPPAHHPVAAAAHLPHVRSASVLPAISKGVELPQASGVEGRPGGRHAAIMQPRLTASHSQPSGIVHVEYTRTGLQRRVGMEPPAAVPIRAVKNSSPKIRFPAP